MLNSCLLLPPVAPELDFHHLPCKSILISSLALAPLPRQDNEGRTKFIHLLCPSLFPFLLPPPFLIYPSTSLSILSFLLFSTTFLLFLLCLSLSPSSLPFLSYLFPSLPFSFSLTILLPTSPFLCLLFPSFSLFSLPASYPLLFYFLPCISLFSLMCSSLHSPFPLPALSLFHHHFSSLSLLLLQTFLLCSHSPAIRILRESVVYWSQPAAETDSCRKAGPHHHSLER